jgi:hypothetical protein
MAGSIAACTRPSSAVVLLGDVFLAKMYFFRTPLRGVVVATVLHVFGLIASQA